MAIRTVDENGNVRYIDPPPLRPEPTMAQRLASNAASRAATSSSARGNFWQGLTSAIAAGAAPVEDTARAVSITAVAGAIAVVAIVVLGLYLARKL